MAETLHYDAGHIIDGKYRITRLLGTGGMGAVYEGENTRIRRKVAIKMLHGAVAAQPDVVKRFEREAQAAALVGSEHICEVLDLGVLPDGTRYMVMEYLEGETLSARIKRFGRLSSAQLVPLLAQVLDALGAAHTAGIIHRDLKPDNIFILPQRGGMKDFIKILDFGVSKFSQTGGEEMNVTRAGAVVGTPYYMSPEQARGMSQIDARTDVYSIGVLLYQATTGQVPYNADTFNELLFKIVLEAPPPPQTYVPDLDPEFGGIILRAMARDPMQRFQSCAEFRDALLAYQASRAQGSSPPVGRASMMQAPTFDPSASAAAQPGAGRWSSLPSAPPAIPAAGAPMAPTPMAASTASASAVHAAMGSTGVPVQPSPMGSSAPGLATPPTGETTSGNPMATSSAWGNASSATTPKRSNAIVAVGVAVTLLVIGGGVAGALLLGKSDKATSSATGADTAKTTASAAPTASAAVTTTVVASATPTTAAVTPSSTPTATTTAAPTATATASAKTTKSTTPVTKTTTPVTKTKPNTTKPVKPLGGDLGY